MPRRRPGTDYNGRRTSGTGGRGPSPSTHTRIVPNAAFVSSTGDNLRKDVVDRAGNVYVVALIAVQGTGAGT